MFFIRISDDKMQAEIHMDHEKRMQLSDEEHNRLKEEITIEQIIELIRSHGITYGILDDQLETFMKKFDVLEDPIIFAKGMEPQAGKNGWLDFHVQLGTLMNIEEGHVVDFKEIMVIPKVETGTKLVTIISPTEPVDGKTVTGEKIKAKPGKPAVLKTGENTALHEEYQAIYATGSGQVSLANNKIQVLPVYEVDDSLSLKTGNIDFNGSIVIRGDVPTGFSLKARGDITIHGIVEAAELEAGGSIFVHEGIHSLGKGHVKAGVDIRARSVNQGNLYAERNIIIENSCLHSHVEANEMLYCQRGHLIGGNISAGKRIQGNDFGNRLSTKTVIFLGQSSTEANRQDELEKEMKKATEQIQKLKLLGEKLESLKMVRDLSSKERVMLLRQKNSLEASELELTELQEQYESLTTENESPEFLKIDVNGIIYPNVHITVGKYATAIKQEYKQVSVIYKHQDFSIVPLS